MNQLAVNGSPTTKLYPPILVIFLAFFAFVFMGGLGAWLGSWLADSYAEGVSALISGGDNQVLDLNKRQALRWFNLLSHFFAFTVSAFTVAFFTKKNKSIARYLGFEKKIKGETILWSTLALLLIFPVIQLIYWLNLQLPLPSWMMEMGKSQDWLVAEFLRMENISELGLMLLIAAVAPAVGEELLFRGLLQTQFAGLFKSPDWGVWVTAFLFSAIHMQFAGFFPRMILGAFLGYLFLWSGSLWLPILIHFLFNGVQIVFSYLYPEQAQSSAVVALSAADYLLGIGAAILLIPLLRKLSKQSEI